MNGTAPTVDVGNRMRMVKRILAIVVMTISVLVLVLSMVGIAGIWIVRGQLAADLEGIVTPVETRAEAVQHGLDRLDTTLMRVRDEVTAVEQEVQRFGADLEQNKPLLTGISNKLGLQLGPLIEKASEIVTTLRETVAALNSIVEGVNALPFVTSPVPELETLNQLSQDLDDLVTEVQDLRTAVDRRQSEIVQGAVGLITTPTAQIGGTLDGMQATVSDYSRQLNAVQEGLSTFKSAVGRGLAWLVVILTLILLWLAFSQAGLLVLGWRVFCGQDLVPRRQPRLQNSAQVRR